MRFVLPILAVFALFAVLFAALGSDRAHASCEPPPCQTPLNVDLDGELDDGVEGPVEELCAYRPRPLERNSRVIALGGQPEAHGIFRPPQRFGA